MLIGEAALALGGIQPATTSQRLLPACCFGQKVGTRISGIFPVMDFSVSAVPSAIYWRLAAPLPWPGVFSRRPPVTVQEPGNGKISAMPRAVTGSTWASSRNGQVSAGTWVDGLYQSGVWSRS